MQDKFILPDPRNTKSTELAKSRLRFNVIHLLGIILIGVVVAVLG